MEAAGVGGAVAEIDRDDITLLPATSAVPSARVSCRQRCRCRHQATTRGRRCAWSRRGRGIAGILSGQLRQEQARIGATGEEMAVRAVVP